MTTLTVMEFLDAVAATPRDWHLINDGEIIRGEGDCPYIAVERHVKTFRLGGPGAVPMYDVWCAADNRKGHNPTIRRALLDACGLLDPGALLGP